MLAKDPAKRYQKPVEVAQALTAFIRPGAKLAPVAGPARELSLGEAAPRETTKGSTPDERSMPPWEAPRENMRPQAPVIEPSAPAQWDTLTASTTAQSGSRVSAAPTSSVPRVTHDGQREAKRQRSIALGCSLTIVGSVAAVFGLIAVLSTPPEATVAQNAQLKERQTEAKPQRFSRAWEPTPPTPVEQFTRPAAALPSEPDPNSPKERPPDRAVPDPPPSRPVRVEPIERPPPNSSPVVHPNLDPLPGLPATDAPSVEVPGKLLKEIVPGYETRDINGFKVLLSTQAIKEGAKDGGRAFKALTTEFDGLVEVLPPKVLEILRRVWVWIEWDNIDRLNPNALAKYYGGRIRVLNGSEHPLKSNAVEVLSLKKLTIEKSLSVERTRLVLLHYLAYAVHHLLLPEGFKNPGVIFAYNQAMERRLYKDVRDSRGGKRSAPPANAAEYFAELTCAYLDRCQYFPFNREELKDYDPTGYRLMEGVWASPGQKDRQRNGTGR
jgi:hypothetical protein